MPITLGSKCPKATKAEFVRRGSAGRGDSREFSFTSLTYPAAISPLRINRSLQPCSEVVRILSSKRINIGINCTFIKIRLLLG